MDKTKIIYSENVQNTLTEFIQSYDKISESMFIELIIHDYNLYECNTTNETIQYIQSKLPTIIKTFNNLLDDKTILNKLAELCFSYTYFSFRFNELDNKIKILTENFNKRKVYRDYNGQCYLSHIKHLPSPIYELNKYIKLILTYEEYYKKLDWSKYIHITNSKFYNSNQKVTDLLLKNISNSKLILEWEYNNLLTVSNYMVLIMIIIIIVLVIFMLYLIYI